MKTHTIENNYLYSSQSRLTKKDRGNVLRTTLALCVGVALIYVAIIAVFCF